MELLLRVWQYPYLYHVISSCIITVYMMILQRRCIVRLDRCGHVIIYAIAGLIAGCGCYVGIIDNEIVLIIIFAISFSVIVIISYNPHITVMAIALGYMITCSVVAKSLIPIGVYICIIMCIWVFILLPKLHKIHVRKLIPI